MRPIRLTAPPLLPLLLALAAAPAPHRAEPPRYVAVASSARQACAIDAGGALKCVGRTSGKPPAGRFRAVAVGHAHGCALREDGALACWGSTADACAAALAAPAGRYTAVAAGPQHTCALRADGALACWGCQPALQPPVGDFVAVGVGDDQACAIRRVGTPVCWGRGADVAAPPAEGRFTAIAVGGSRACALRDDGTLACWGNGLERLPEHPAGRFVALDARGRTTCAIRDDHAAICWGLRDSRRARSPEAQAAGELQEGGRRFDSVSVVGDRAWGLTTEGSVVCLGGPLECAPRRVKPANPPELRGAAALPAPASSPRGGACRPAHLEDREPVRRQVEEALRAPWVAEFAAARGRPPRVGIGRYLRSDEPGLNSIPTAGTGWSSPPVEVTLARTALAADGRVVPNGCFFATDDRVPDRWSYAEDCSWDAEERFDVEPPDFALEIVSEPAAPEAGAAGRRRTYSLAVREVRGGAVVWSKREEATLPCARPAPSHPQGMPVGFLLGASAGAELGPGKEEGGDSRWYGFRGRVLPVFHKLGCGGVEFRHCNYAALGVSASGPPFRLGLDLGLHEVGLLWGSVSAGALFEPADGGTRYGVEAASRVGLSPVLGVGLGLRAWAMVSEPKEYGVRLTLDLASYFREPVLP
jgi:hypothetical protein